MSDLRVVLIDGDDVRRGVWTRRLQRLGCRVLQARTPLEAIAHVVRGGVAAAVVAEPVGNASAAELLAAIAGEAPAVALVPLHRPQVEGHALGELLRVVAADSSRSAELDERAIAGHQH